MRKYKITAISFFCLLAFFLICSNCCLPGVFEKRAMASVSKTIEQKAASLITEEAFKHNIEQVQKDAGKDKNEEEKKKEEKEEEKKEDDILAKITKSSTSFDYGRTTSSWVNTKGETVTAPKRKTLPSFSAFSENAFSEKQKQQELPDAFDLRKEIRQELAVVPSVWDQEAYGLCWAIAGLEAIQSSIVLQELPYKKSWLTNGELRFSAAHMGWHLFEKPPESDGIRGDYLERAYKGSDGGDSTAVISALSSGYGLQLEKNAPYTSWNYGQSSAGRYTAYYQLRHADYLDSASTQEARTTVKQWIASRGAVETGLYFSQQKKEECYYQEQYDETYGNHEIILIGWDDHYSKENFKENGAVPEYDGAWLAQNSYGREWGEEGCFYISYEEPSLFGFVSYELEERNDEETCYQYDGAGSWIGVSSASLSAAANIFTATEHEILKEVGVSLLELNSSGADYQIQIYKWEAKPPMVSKAGMVNTGDLIKEELPDFSEKARVEDAEIEGTLEYPGYHKLALKTPVELKEGERFAVVLTLFPRDHHSTIYYSFEGSIEGYDMDSIHYGFEKEQTYYQKGFGEQAEWKDVASIKKEKEGFALGNLNVKAFTYALPEESEEESTQYQEQRAQLEETVKIVREFLDFIEPLKAAGADTGESEQKVIESSREFAFTKGNHCYNGELVSLLKDVCNFAEETLSFEKPAVYELENAYNSLASAMDYMAYPAEQVITKAQQLYDLSKQMSELAINALGLVSIEKDIIMNPNSAFQFDRFDTEQDKSDKGVIIKIRSQKAKTFYPIGGRGGAEFTLEGNGHSISGLICSTKASSENNTGSYAGLIGILTKEGAIRNLTIKNSYIEGNYCVGAFAGALAYGGVIESCTIKNTYIYGYEQWLNSFYTTAASHVGGFAGLATAYSSSRRSGIYDSAMKECLVYGEILTGGIVGAVNSGASAGNGNKIWNSSVAGIATYGESRSGVGLYLGGETGNEKDAKNQEEISKHYIFNNSSAAEKDYLFLSIYKPKRFRGEKQMLLFIEPYNRTSRTLKSVLLQGTAKKKKRGKSYKTDGWRIQGMSGDITITPMTKELYQVSFYSSLTGECLSNQSIIRGKKAKHVKAPKVKGYRFLGFYDASGKKFQFGKKIKAGSQLYTKYEKSKKKKK